MSNEIQNRPSLYPFQERGVEFLDSTGGRALLGDEMGLGKTPQSLVWARVHVDRLLVVAPANVTHKWIREIKTWTNFQPHRIASYTDTIPTHASALVTSYNIMTKRYKELRDWKPELVIWDEAHYLKGNRKKVKRVAAAMRLKSPYVLCLSGTPFLNRPIELFNLLDICQPGQWNLGTYGNRYCGGFDYWKGPLKGAYNLEELKQKLQSVMIRRLKRDVLADLPKLQRVVHPVDIRTVEYKEALRNLNTRNAITKIMDAWHIVGREKAKVAVDFVQDFFAQSEDTSKIVVYAHHLDVVDYLKENLREYGTFSIDGRIAPDKRDRLVVGFQKGLSPRVAVINKAGGEGIDLFGIGDIDSSTILFVERQWTPALEWQAEGRLDRIGQRSPVTAHYLLALGTFDARMDQEINAKRELLDRTIGLEDIELKISALDMFDDL